MKSKFSLFSLIENKSYCLRWTNNDASARTTHRWSCCQQWKCRKRKSEHETSIKNSNHRHSRCSQVADHDAERQRRLARPKVCLPLVFKTKVSKSINYSMKRMFCKTSGSVQWGSPKSVCFDITDKCSQLVAHWNLLACQFDKYQLI